MSLPMVCCDKTGDTYSSYLTGYPFEPLLSFVAIVKDIINYFHNRHVVKAKLDELQKQNSVLLLLVPVQCDGAPSKL
jgi:hypothetical protein